MPAASLGLKSSPSACSTVSDWEPGTVNPPPIRFSVCFSESGTAIATTMSHAANTHHRRRVRNSDS
jgi:hypothetical protein